ncbi:BLUF domain-containing protein [Vibrio quintilis]|uniref:Sensors of blue-light using FAD n=1 Tax=Vibrio quintilis TaxID=1117707 RepID=A0A1M7YXC4_9VIBR|nr:BLUF domain-containing protein [Vibrio quintilis]SHO57281.1 Sensors of blue-light using FAD [Vibrio quintilis]
MTCKYLLYSSTANLAEVNVHDILEVSREKNKQFGITGYLISHFNGFYQYIEGDEAAIDQLYHNISADDRHSDVEILLSGYRDTRLFPDWQMGYLRVETEDVWHWGQAGQNNNAIEEFYQAVSESLVL